MDAGRRICLAKALVGGPAPEPGARAGQRV